MARKELVIAIDGPAASGKSTTARLVADRLGYTYIDTGAMYRAVTYAVLEQRIDPSDQQAVERFVAGLDIRLRRADDGSLHVCLDGVDVASKIRTPEVTANVSLVSSYAGVRGHLVRLQQLMGQGGGVVLDGRDIGTVVFPDADVKVFMIADIDARATRRLEELRRAGSSTSLDELRQDIARRDRFDSSRALAPLCRAEDAVEIDTSTMNIEEQVERVIELAEGILATRAS